MENQGLIKAQGGRKILESIKDVTTIADMEIIQMGITGLIYKTKQDSFDEMMTEIVEETIMSDYKKVEGMMIAHVLTVLRDGKEFGTLTVTDVDFNSGLEDSFFKKEE